MSSIKRFSLVFLVFICTNAFAMDRKLLSNTSFEKNLNRYPSVLGIIENIKRLAPFQKQIKDESELEPCLQVGPDSAPLLGAIDPGQLQPLENEAGALLFPYFSACAKKVIQLGFSDEGLAKRNSQLILGDDLTKALKTSNWATIPLTSIDPEIRDQITDRFILFLLGPEELLSHPFFRFIGPDNVFAQPELQTGVDLRRFLVEHFMKKNPNDSLLGFYTRMATLLRLGPAFKNLKIKDRT